MQEKIYDGEIFNWILKRKNIGIVQVSDLEPEMKPGEFWNNLPRSISVKSPKTGVEKTFEFIELRNDENAVEKAVYRAHIENVGNVTLIIWNS